MEEKLKIANDVAEKLERLRWRLEQPELFISEHFASIRNEIDLDTEQLIDSFRNENASTKQIDDLNATRTQFIEFLDKMEASLAAKPKDASSSSTFDSFNELEKRVKEFSTSKYFKSLNEIEEVYLQLALDVIEATNEVERRLLTNQTIYYVSHGMTDSIMGNLIYLSEDFLNRDELCCLKSKSVDFIRLIRETLQASLNASLVVGVCRPFVLSKKILILSNLIAFNCVSSASSAGKIVYLEDSSMPNFNLSFDDSQFHKKLSFNSMQIFGSFYFKCIDSVLLGEISATFSGLKAFCCNLYGNRLRRFEVADSLCEAIDQLNLSLNQLETLDVEQLAKMTKLEHLRLVEACLPDTRFSLDFLTSLPCLAELQLTLPDVSIDLKVFQNLKTLELLELHSATSIDSSVERIKLTKDHFKQLSKIKYLRNLRLSHFEIESLQKVMINELVYLERVDLVDNHIARIEEAAFEKSLETKYCTIELRQNSIRSISSGMFHSLSLCKDLDLSYNQIEQLPHGVFAELKSLRKLHLNNNSIRKITRGVFNNLPYLVKLQLDGNLIESIDPHSFEGSPKITRLFLAHNKLKSINYQNEIQSNEMEESDHKMKSVFCELVSLETLSLEGNQLEKVDLNCFIDLTKLIRLNLSNNRISELNDQIQAGVLSNLIEIDISNNQLTQISRHAFSESTDLIAIKLSANKLETLDEDFFEPFESLIQLELQNNNLSIDITAQTFSRCLNIKEINLLGNPRVRIRDAALSGPENLECIRLEIHEEEDTQRIKRFLEHQENRTFFEKLKELSMVNSAIESFDAFKLEKRFFKLRWLELKGNRIKNISRDCLIEMPHLRLLNLADNLIETLDDPSLFNDMPNLENLNLSRNNLKLIHRQLFKGLDQLTTLDLSNNLSLLELDAGMFRGLFNLENLNLAENNIASFDLSSLFRSCSLLKYLDLSNNQLDNKSINEDTMSGIIAQNLNQLMLANNRLENIDFVRHLYRLEKLDLSGNKIESVTSNGVNIFSRLVKLKHVNLSNNQIESLDSKAIFSHLKYQLEFIDCSSNVFNLIKTLKCSKNFHLFIEKNSK